VPLTRDIESPSLSIGTMKIRIKDDRYTIYDEELSNVVLSITVLNPMKETKGHSHIHEEAYYFISGKGVAIIGENKLLVEPGTFVAIPTNTFHKIKNTENKNLVFACAWGK
jgi:mannose-6-phosphate isomerase-like protein (cupin superfamily)